VSTIGVAIVEEPKSKKLKSLDAAETDIKAKAKIGKKVAAMTAGQEASDAQTKDAAALE